MMDEESDWIFYLKLTPKLPAKFFELDHLFRANGHTLVPVTFKDLVSINKGKSDFHVITAIGSFEEAGYFQKRVRKLAHYFLRSKRMHLYMASSFKFVDDTHLFGASGMYHYVQLPVGLKKFCDTITKTIKAKKSNKRKWPGASRGLGNTIG